MKNFALWGVFHHLFSWLIDPIKSSGQNQSNNCYLLNATVTKGKFPINIKVIWRNSNDLFSDALLIAAISIFSSLVYLGYLKAFGATNLDGLISLQIQSILPVFISIVLVGGMFIIYILDFINFSHKLIKSAKIRRIISTAGLIALVLPVVAFIYAIDTDIKDRIIFTIILAVGVMPLLFYGTYPTGWSRLLGNLMPERLSVNAKEMTATIVLVFMLLPMYAYSFGFLNAINQTNFYITKRTDGDYIVLRQDGGQLILEKIDGNRLDPTIVTQILDAGSSFSFELKHIEHLDFTKIEEYQSGQIRKGGYMLWPL